MQVEIIRPEPVKEKNKYPCLLESNITDNLVVLFIDDGRGVVVNPGDSVYQRGHFQEYFSMNKFRKFNGSITLKND